VVLEADFVRTVSDEAIALHLKYAAKMPTAESTMHLYPIHGAAGRVKKTATPWWHRVAVWAEAIVGVDGDPATKEEITAWAKEYWSALHPHSLGGAYINFMMEGGDERIRATYGKNYERLAKIKKRYDPTNVFRVNQNIRPR
jgi:FAD/FMN-containing dehydrogenase